jgi:hypothetical protein
MLGIGIGRVITQDSITRLQYLEKQSLQIFINIILGPPLNPGYYYSQTQIEHRNQLVRLLNRLSSSDKTRQDKTGKQISLAQTQHGGNHYHQSQSGNKRKKEKITRDIKSRASAKPRATDGLSSHRPSHGRDILDFELQIRERSIPVAKRCWYIPWHLIMLGKWNQGEEEKKEKDNEGKRHAETPGYTHTPSANSTGS